MQKDCQAYVKSVSSTNFTIGSFMCWILVYTQWLQLGDMWALDMVRPIHPHASYVYKNILAASRYFFKWIEAIILRTIEEKYVVCFIHILYQFGSSHDVVLNNGTYFKDEKMRSFSKLKIKHHLLAPYYHHENRQANK